MIVRDTAVEDIAAIGHDEAMDLAAAECDRLLAVADCLQGTDWLRQTDCPEWNVTQMLAHLLGMFELQSDGDERMRQFTLATAAAEQTGCLRIDAMTELQVREHAALPQAELREAIRHTIPRAVAGRTSTTREQRSAPFPSGVPGEDTWTFGYLFDIILTRDPWIHRVDICRAIECDVELTPNHDGRIVADVVVDWARRHGQPFTLFLTGPAGGRFSAGNGGPDLELDAVAFCRILSGRAPGSSLLATRVPF